MNWDGQGRWDLSWVLRKEEDCRKEDHSMGEKGWAGSVVSARGRDVNADWQGRLRSL